MTAKRISPEEHQQIIDLKLDCVPVLKIAETVGCSTATVVDHWHKWLDETTEERRANLERKRSEVIGRLQSVASIARRGAVEARTSYRLILDRADDATAEEYDDIKSALASSATAEARFLAEERQALKELSRIAGWDAPTRIATSVEPLSDEAALAIIAEFNANPD